MTRRKLTRRGAAICSFAVLLAAAAVLLSACGSGDKPAVHATTLFPSPAASQGRPDKGADATASPGASASPSPSSTGANGSGGGSGSSGTPTAKITDKNIRGNILVRLSQEPNLRGLQFKVIVNDGSVVLTGRVKSKEQKHSAEQIAVSEPGVKKVLSYIEVTGRDGY